MAAASRPRLERNYVRVRVAVVVGFALVALGVGVALLHSPLEIAGTSVASAADEVIRTAGRGRVCQAGERIPSGTSALYLALSTESIGPRVIVEVFSGGQPLSRGSKAAGWRGTGITIPIKSIARTTDIATVCIGIGEHREILTVYGAQTSGSSGAYSAGERLSGKAKIEFLRPARRSWWSLLLPVGRRLGLGHAAGGTWLAGALFIVMGFAVILGTWLVARELSARA